jgi:hypothetical protein
MKKTLFIVLIATVSIFTNSCRKALKDVNDYYPKVKLVSTTVQQDGSIKLIAEIESKGGPKNSVIDNVGFCVSTNSDPKMLDNQIISTLNGTSFTAIYPVGNFNVDSIYYFKAWATSNYGYAYSNIKSVDSIIATPVVAPCTLPANSLNTGTSSPTYSYYTVGAPDASNYFTASSSGPSNVYVNRLSADSYEITICNAPWTANFTSSTLYFNTRLVTPL